MKIEEITARLGISPSRMQEAAAGAILGTSDNVVILSPTGSGKTLAYLLPLAETLNAQSDELQAIVVVPGRELAQQSAEVLASMKAGLRGYACYGGRLTMDEHREIRKIRPQVIFATPGRMNDHIDKDNVSTQGVRFIVIDEFDKCLAMGFRDEMAKLLSRIPHTARRIFLSATDIDEKLGSFRRLDFRPKEAATDDGKVAINVVRSPDKDKLTTLAALLRSLGQASSIVFLNYRESVERTAGYLRGCGFTVAAYHGGLDQRQREEALYGFANGSANVLVSTDLGSRGLDMPIVDNIVHYHLPENEDAYVHRIGRSTRWEKSGSSFFLLGPGETLPPYVEGVAEDFVLPANLPEPAQPLMATIYVGRGKKNKISKGDIVGFLCKKGGLTTGDIGRIDVYEYYSLAAVRRAAVNALLRNVAGEKIKGQKTIVEEHK